MEFHTDQNIAILRSAIDYFRDTFTTQGSRPRSLKLECLAAGTLVKLIRCQQELLSKTEAESNVLYHAYVVFKMLQNRGRPITWKQLIQSRALRSGGVKFYRPAMDFLVDAGMVDVDYAEKSLDNVYTLTGKRFLIGSSES